jgi:N-acetylglucosamine malate deacetylase 1
MTDRVLVIAPHPDDETLGCGGTLLSLREQGTELTWLIVTSAEGIGWTPERLRQRETEIAEVARLVGFSRVVNLGLPASRLDTVPRAELVEKLSAEFRSYTPSQVFLPSGWDAHSDHRVVFEAASACTKWFRHPYVRRVLAYETLSETGFGLDSAPGFCPNYFVDISNFLERKLAVAAVYGPELGTFPFPRSTEAIRALASVRGAASGFVAAEAFQLLLERV